MRTERTKPETAKIRAARQARALSQYELAKRAGLHPATISNAERGLFTDVTVKKIAAALGVRPEELQQ